MGKESEITSVRRQFIADEELSDIEEEYARWLRRKAEGGKAEECAGFLAAYAKCLKSER